MPICMMNGCQLTCKPCDIDLLDGVFVHDVLQPGLCVGVPVLVVHCNNNYLILKYAHFLLKLI